MAYPSGLSLQPRCGSSSAVAHTAIQRLERMEIVKLTTGEKRDLDYCTKALLNILEEPAKLTGSPSE